MRDGTFTEMDDKTSHGKPVLLHGGTVKNRLNTVSAVDSHPGHRRMTNEDGWLDAGYQGLWVVADGMGHDGRGMEACRMVIDSLGECRLHGDIHTRRACVVEVLTRLHRHLCYDKTGLSGRFPGSTVTVVILHGNRMICIWVGDTRCYLLRRCQLYQLTRDHTRVAAMVRSGRLTREQAATHPERNVITRAVGAGREAFLPESIEMDLYAGDTLLLCTDGLYREMSEAQIAEGMRLSEVNVSVRQLMNTGLQTAASDNLTAMVLKMR